MQITGNFTNFYGLNMLPLVHSIIIDRYKQYPPLYNKLVQVNSSSRSGEQVTGMAGLGTFRLVAEGAPVTYDKGKQGLTKSYTHSDFALAFLVTRQIIRDDKIQLIRKMANSLVRMNRESIDIQASSMYNFAFNSSLQPLPSGQALCSTAQPYLKIGGTWSNKLVAADLNMTSIQAAMTMFRTMKGESGEFQRVNPKMLIHAPAMEFKALKLLKSTDDPETANRSTNTLRYGTFGLPEPVINQYIEDPTAWFLQAAPMDTDLYWWWREKPYEDHWTDNPTRSAHHAMWYACSYGPASPNGIVGVATS